MTVETRLAELHAQELELLRTPCAACRHPLAVHSRVAAACSGLFGGPYCSCKGFQDTTDERLRLKAPLSKHPDGLAHKPFYVPATTRFMREEDD